MSGFIAVHTGMEVCVCIAHRRHHKLISKQLCVIYFNWWIDLLFKVLAI